MTRQRAWPRAAAARIRGHGPSLLLAAAAAGFAFLVAGLLFGGENAVFAPVAAVVATGLAAGQRVVRATEISLGVVLGILAADLLTSWLGAGPLQVAFAVLLAMGAAVAVRPSGLMANQAAVAAVVVIALVPHLETGPWVRLGDAVVGGLVAIGLNAVAAPDPLRAARSVTEEVLVRLEAVLDQVIGALESGSLAAAEAALEEMAGLDGARDDIAEALAATRERPAWRPAERRGRRTAVGSVRAVVSRVVVLLATVRGLCRAAANLVRHEPARTTVRPGLVAATQQLVEAVREMRRWVMGQGRPELVRELALRSAVTASGLLPSGQPTAVYVGQLRGATVDLLRATGATQAEAVLALEAAAGRADELGA